MYIPRQLVAITCTQRVKHMRDYTVVAKDQEGRVIFKYLLVFHANGPHKHSHIVVTFTDGSHRYKYTQRTKGGDGAGGAHASFLLRIIRELKQWRIT